MAVEAKRKCGYRPQGATYLVSDTKGFACGRLPIALAPCPLCTHVPGFTRGLQQVNPKEILVNSQHCSSPIRHCEVCPAGSALGGEQAGLMWVGEKFYSPEEFTAEARDLGISKRVPFPLPRWLEIGKTWIFVAHPAATTGPCAACRGAGSEIQEQEPEMIGGALQDPLFKELAVACEECEGGGREPRPAVFHAFVPTRIERIVPDSMPEVEREALRARGLTLVVVPALDPDHAPRGRRRE